MKKNLLYFFLGMLIASGPVGIWVNESITNSKERTHPISDTQLSSYTPSPNQSITPTPNKIKSLTSTASVNTKSISITPTITPIPTNIPSPTPTEKPQDLASVKTSYDQVIDKYAQMYGANSEIMKHIAMCESGFRQEAVNGPYGGMYQFHSGTWNSNRLAMGEDPNPQLRFSAEESIKTAAFKMGRDGYGAWPECSRKAFQKIASI